MGGVVSEPDTPDIEMDKEEEQPPPEKEKQPLKRKGEEKRKQRRKQGVKKLTIPLGGAKKSKSGLGIPKNK